MTIHKLLVVITAASALTACGGTDTIEQVGFSNPPPVATPNFVGVGGTRPDADNIDSIFTYLGDITSAAQSDLVSVGTPSTNLATYNGLVVMDVSSTQSMVGNATINANFGNSLISGTTSDYVLTGGPVSAPIVLDDLDGSIAVSNSSIFTAPSGAEVFAFDLNGTVNGTTGSYTTAVTVDGLFFNNGSKNVALGILDGTVTSSANGLYFTDGAVVASQ